MAIGRTEDRDTPRDPVMLQHRLKCLGLDPRNPSGPAVMPTAYKGRTHDRNRPDPSQLQKNPCKPGAVHTWIPACAGMTLVVGLYLIQPIRVQFAVKSSSTQCWSNRRETKYWMGRTWRLFTRRNARRSRSVSS